jgi:alanine racemase
LKITRPVWIEINLDNLSHNVKEIKRVLNSGTLLTAVIKADAYGHGALGIAETLIESGVDRFAVATLSEAMEIRDKFKDTPILILGYTPKEFLSPLVEYDITPTIYSLAQAEELSRAATVFGKTVNIHIKIDTGMHRVGMAVCSDSVDEIRKISKLPNILIEGIYTHFATSDEADKSYTLAQVEKFKTIISDLEDIGINIPIKHVSNSAAIIDLPNLNYNMVRAGIILYGLYPSNFVDKDNVRLKEVLSLHGRIYHIKELDKGMGVSYGLTYKTKVKSKIATLPIGYADGFSRLLSNKASAILKGKNKIVPLIGTICMDKCMLDVTGIEVEECDEVILIGSDGDKSITATDVADILGTINYEIVCMMKKRIPRVYIKNGNIVSIKDEVYPPLSYPPE